MFIREPAFSESKPEHREVWTEKRWPELCEEMARVATARIHCDRDEAMSIRAEIADMLQHNDVLAAKCYRAEIQGDGQ